MSSTFANHLADLIFADPKFQSETNDLLADADERLDGLIPEFAKVVDSFDNDRGQAFVRLMLAIARGLRLPMQDQGAQQSAELLAAALMRLAGHGPTT